MILRYDFDWYEFLLVRLLKALQVTNGDECVTVKSPAHNFLIENIYCNLSGGTAIGSLGTGTDISDISYKHLYLNRADGCYLKTNNGDGTVKNIVWDTVIVHGGPYPLTINEAWGADRGSSGVAIHNLTFKVSYRKSCAICVHRLTKAFPELARAELSQFTACYQT
jgi:rhamnogalacturonan hydrolase